MKAIILDLNSGICSNMWGVQGTTINAHNGRTVKWYVGHCSSLEEAESYCVYLNQRLFEIGISRSPYVRSNHDLFNVVFPDNKLFSNFTGNGVIYDPIRVERLKL